MMNKGLYYYTKDGELNGYYLWFYDNFIAFICYDFGVEVEYLSVNNAGETGSRELIEFDKDNKDVKLFIDKNKGLYAFVDQVYKDLVGANLLDIIAIEARLAGKYGEAEAYKMAWIYERKIRMENKDYDNNEDFLPFYIQQNELKEQVIKEDHLPNEIKYIAGVDVAYNDSEQRMIGAIVVLDATTLEVVEEVYHEMDITFPYIPGLFSFREIPPLLQAYKKLTVKLDLIICDGQGIAHPKGVGMATHLGIELDIPTIGCAKKRLVGSYDRKTVGIERGSTQSLVWDSQVVGAALRTQTDVKPMFVSIGHKVSLETAISWVLKLCPKYRLPETTRQADQLVNKLMKDRTEIDLYPDD